MAAAGSPVIAIGTLAVTVWNWPTAGRVTVAPPGNVMPAVGLLTVAVVGASAALPTLRNVICSVPVSPLSRTPSALHAGATSSVTTAVVATIAAPTLKLSTTGVLVALVRSGATAKAPAPRLAKAWVKRV